MHASTFLATTNNTYVHTVNNYYFYIYCNCVLSVNLCIEEDGVCDPGLLGMYMYVDNKFYIMLKCHLNMQ